MLQSLSQRHDQEVQEFLAAAPGFALFIIGDLENFGYETSYQDLWGDRDQEGALRAVLLRYYTNYVIYAPGAYDADLVAKKIQESGDWTNINGWSEAVGQVVPLIKDGNPKELYFAECAGVEREAEILDCVTEAKLEDIDGIIALRGRIEEFSPSKDEEKIQRQKMESQSGRDVVCKIDGRIVAGAATTAENSQSAMVVGVCTHPDHRKQGYASACVTKLATEYEALGKRLYLFYDNPKAGRIYNRIGFHEIGMYMMIQR